MKGVRPASAKLVKGDESQSERPERARRRECEQTLLLRMTKAAG